MGECEICVCPKGLIPGVENRNAEQIKILHVSSDQGKPVLKSRRRDQPIGHAERSARKLPLRAERPLRNSPIVTKLK
jgi:hypothetical protein